MGSRLHRCVYGTAIHQYPLVTRVAVLKAGALQRRSIGDFIVSPCAYYFCSPVDLVLGVVFSRCRLGVLAFTCFTRWACTGRVNREGRTSFVSG